MKQLLKLARSAIETELENKPLIITEEIRKKFNKKQACFVTLTINNELRGCIGSLHARQELYKDVIENDLTITVSEKEIKISPVLGSNFTILLFVPSAAQRKWPSQVKPVSP